MYKVVETPLNNPASAKIIGDFGTRHEALITCVKSMKSHLTGLAKPGLNAKELFAQWKETGTAYHIEPEDSDAPFSDIDFTRLFVLRLTNDYSHPIFMEVSTVDCLRTANGVNSPSRNWKFWVKAPTTYEGDGLDALMQAGVDVLYDRMSQQSRAADGSSYRLLQMSYRTVGENEALAAIKADPNATVYFVQNDCSFERNLPVNPMASAR